MQATPRPRGGTYLCPVPILQILDRAGVDAGDISHVALHTETTLLRTHANQCGSAATHSHEGGTHLKRTSPHSPAQMLNQIIHVPSNVCTFFLIFASWGLRLGTGLGPVGPSCPQRAAMLPPWSWGSLHSPAALCLPGFPSGTQHPQGLLGGKLVLKPHHTWGLPKPRGKTQPISFL